MPCCHSQAWNALPYRYPLLFFTFSFRYSVWTELRDRCLWEAMLDPPKPRLHPPLCASSHSTPCCLNLSQCIGDSEIKPECFWTLVVWPQAESSYSKNCQQGFKDGSGIGRSIWFQEKSHCWVLLTMLHYQFIFLEIPPKIIRNSTPKGLLQMTPGHYWVSPPSSTPQRWS